MELTNSDNNNNTGIIDAIGPLGSQLMAGKKLSHKAWRGVLKKLKRKLKRRKAAQENQENASCNGDASEDDAVAEHIQFKEMQLQSVEHARWLQREKKAHEEWLRKKWLEEQEKKRQEEQDRRIREEWEEQQKKEREEKEKEEQEERKKKEKQEALLSEATANEKSRNGLQPWHNPLAPPVYGKDAEVCSFFMKTGACRFGERCSRSHPEPESCHTLMFPGMFTHISLDKNEDDYDTDLNLEFEEGEIYEDFKLFYEDVLPEFKDVGQVVQLKVSCNFEPHLRGNVYVQYKTEEEALKAYAKFNGRWYGGKQLSCQVVEIKRWVSAICGLYNENRCHKGKSCNFLHVFHNPTREFNRADRDFDRQNYRHTPSQHRRESSVHSHRSSSSRHSSSRHERSHPNDYYKHSYSPSRSRSASRQSFSHKSEKRITSSRNHSSQIKSSKRKRSRSRSRSRGRSRSRSKPRIRSRSRSQTRSRSRTQSRSKSRSRSPQSSRSSSKKSEKRSHSSQNSKGHKKSQSKHKGHSKKSKSHSKSHSRSRSSSQLPSKSHGKSSPSTSSSSSSSSLSP